MPIENLRPLLKSGLRISLGISIVIAMLGLGYIRDSYVLMWQDFELQLISRTELISSNLNNVEAKIPAFIYLILFYSGNSAMLSIIFNTVAPWQFMLVMYMGLMIVGGFLFLMGVLSDFYYFFGAAQHLKEFLLSPIPFLLLTPLLIWLNKSEKFH